MWLTHTIGAANFNLGHQLLRARFSLTSRKTYNKHILQTKQIECVPALNDNQQTTHWRFTYREISENQTTLEGTIPKQHKNTPRRNTRKTAVTQGEHKIHIIILVVRWHHVQNLKFEIDHIWRKPHLVSANRDERLHRAIVLSTILYVFETWPVPMRNEYINSTQSGWKSTCGIQQSWGDGKKTILKFSEKPRFCCWKTVCDSETRSLDG